MTTIACSLHLMDVRLLKIFVSAFQGGTLPDLKVEADRRARRDILFNWSRKIIRAAAPLATMVPPERWMLYTRLRPFFITVDDPAQAAMLTERFFSARNLDEILNYYLEEVARIDPERATEIVDTARGDREPGMVPHFPAEEIATHFRTYLLHERRQLDQLTEAMAHGGATAAAFTTAGRQLTWRTCQLLANLHPGWSTGATCLTKLAAKPEQGWAALVADPRGMYAQLYQKIPALQAHVPYCLCDQEQTGMCVSPQAVPTALSLLSGLAQPLPVELQAVQEALLYAQQHTNAGLWEAAGLLDPARALYPIILDKQGEREEHPERFTAPTTEISTPAPAMPPTTVEDDFARRWENTRPLTGAGEQPEAVKTDKTSWLQKMFKR